MIPKKINLPSTQSPSTTRKTCPVIKGYPLIGVTSEFVFDLPQLLQRIVKEHPGELVALKIGPIHIYLTSHPDHVQYVLTTNEHNFGKGHTMWKGYRLIAANGLAISEGETWFRNRRLMQPFFTHKHISSLANCMITATLKAVERFEQVVSDSPIDMHKELQQIMQSTMLETIFGTSLERHKIEATADAIQVALRAIHLRSFLYFLPEQLPLPGERTLRHALQTIDDILLSIIRERRQSRENRDDLLSLLLQARDEETKTGMNDQQLRDECVTLFVAGHETTATALTWLWYLLDEHPEVDRKLRAEIDSVLGGRQPTFADLANLRYTRMVIQETLRLYPPGCVFPRVVRQNDEIDGYPVKAGATIILSPYMTHHLPDFWNQPDVFNPERFTAEQSEQRHSYAYFPFGAGSRHCIGNHFALMQAQLAVVIIAQKWRPRRIRSHTVKPQVKAFVLCPRNGLPMILEPV
ncbi:cytochrome P450 [Scytonema sp. UIC 10036]|uniref:cytochrome P450 n=1 Tax=Scytonema sp. UIC 10036 TaxID=2304196 RepID=UPI001FA956FC|nr:cytochrome P450 [Scytonema sp. UIC 10036]